MNESVEAMRAARIDSPNVAYMDFTKLVGANKTGLFCFFEGKDSPYYSLRIKNVFNEGYHPIICSGKSKVLKVYELINNHEEYGKYKKGFFIDSDFDEPLSNKKIYETPCYSIENLYTSVSVFGEILKSELGFTEIDTDFIKSVELYENLQHDYHKATTLFNAWYACLVNIRNSTHKPMEINLDKSIPQKFIFFSLGEIKSNYSLSDIKAEYPKAIDIDEDTVNAKIAKFEVLEKGKIFRGKFELHFTLKFLNSLIEDSAKTKKYVTKKLNYHITETQAIPQFSQYAETPESLIKYIRRICK